MWTIVLNALGVAGIIVWHMQGHTRQTERLVSQIVFFLTMSVVLVLARIVPFRFDAPHIDGSRSLIVLAKILWWTHLSWATIGILRIYIVFDGRPREARLIQDLLVAIVYLGVLLSVMAFVFGVPIGTLLATSGVFAIILGLALQNTLGDVFSGVALTLGRPYVIGDWILLQDGTEGRVVASNWRSTYLLTSSHNHVVVPNSVLAKQGLTNISKPDESHQITLSVRIVPTRSPKFIVDVMHSALKSCNSIAQEPAASVSLVGIDAVAVDIQLFLRVTSPAQRIVARNDMIDLVYRHCRAHGLVFARPIGSPLLHDDRAESPGVDVATLLDSIPLFFDLTHDERELLASSAVLRTVAADELLVGRGEVCRRFMVIKQGVVVLREDGRDILRLAPGDMLGAGGVFAELPENREATAMTQLEVYEFSSDVIDLMFAEKPSARDRIRMRLASGSINLPTAQPPAASAEGTRSDFVRSIRSVFGTR
ncbi:mechanosensitive ion channel family protein [Rhizobium sp. CECT 9324]|uniref:mechanosensitive ion channel domain-containing protein n=1 Tax=Rhizobium sp. CECT 9324 TaxID=2845820 RepID=UPI001E4C64FE|nr:mechanosensitive ion channel family protein [Rhizobium sp. CECT 9324]